MMNQDLTQLKQAIDIIALAQSYNLAPKRQGQNWLAKCPFHADQTASLSFTPSKELYHCFGCGAAGSVIDLVMQMEGLSFHQAVEKLKQDYGLPNGIDRIDANDDSKANKANKNNSFYENSLPQEQELLSKPTKLKEPLTQPEIYQLRELYVKLSKEALMQAQEGSMYLIRRGIFSQALLEEFSVGYVERFGYPYREILQTVALAKEKMCQAGLLRESHQEHLSGSVIVPIYNQTGDLVQIYGRRVISRKDSTKHLYLPAKLQGIFNLRAIARSKCIILCEAIFDAMSFWQADFTSVTTSFGVNGFTSEMLEVFLKQGIKIVLLAYDGDPAGERAAIELSKQLQANAINTYRLRFPNGLDANAFANKYLPTREHFTRLIEEATWLGSGKAPELDLVSLLSKNSSVEIYQPIIPITPTNTIIPTDEKANYPLAEKVAIPLAENILASLQTNETEYKELPSTTTVDSNESQSTSNSSNESGISSQLESNQSDTTNQETQQQLSEELNYSFGERNYRVRGWKKNTSHGQMKVNLRLSYEGKLHIDTLDLCLYRHRQEFTKIAQSETGIKAEIIQKDLAFILDNLEKLQDQLLVQILKPTQTQQPPMTALERQQAMEFLLSKDIKGQILESFRKCSVVGEETNLLMCYMAATSRKLDKPLGILIQSSSAAGKTSLMDAVLAFMPKEELVKYSALTGQSLFYFEDISLKHKILSIAEESGARRASYPLKLLLSEGEVSIASTAKDAQSGKLQTFDYKVEGPVCLFSTTTAFDVDEELLNRCIVLCVNEERKQTKAIHEQQRELETQLWSREQREEICKLHQNAQRLLRNISVKNPYAKALTFLDDKTRTRRDHQKYLTLINSIALLHQYQRKVKSETRFAKTKEYIEVELADIELANHIANQILGHSLDELQPQTRKFLILLYEMGKDFCKLKEIQKSDWRFTQREVREYTGFGNTQVKVHLQRLIEMEYVLVHKTTKGQQFLYELVYDGEGKDGSSFVLGLIDVNKLSNPANNSSDNTAMVGEKGSQTKVVGAKSVLSRA